MYSGRLWEEAYRRGSRGRTATATVAIQTNVWIAVAELGRPRFPLTTAVLPGVVMTAMVAYCPGGCLRLEDQVIPASCDRPLVVDQLLAERDHVDVRCSDVTLQVGETCRAVRR